MKVDILAIGVHPDDIELSCAGTLLRHIDLGYKVGLLDLTRGEMGTRGTPAIRKQEAENAAKLLGASFRETLDMQDAFFAYSKENLLKIVKILRRHRPGIVLANALNDRHPDHGRAAKLIADACFYSGLKQVKTQEDMLSEQKAWRPDVVYHYIQDYNLPPDFVVDISDYIDKKMEIVKAFQSQFFNPHATEFEMEEPTPISSKSFMDFLQAKAATYGRPAGFDYGEGFNVARTPGVEDLFFLK